MKRARFTPSAGETFTLKDSNQIYKCIKTTGIQTAIMQNKETRWTLEAHGLAYYEDGSIDWDFSTGGHFEGKEKKGMYEVIDWYEGYMLIGTYATKKQAKQAAKEFEADTDGECNIEIREI